MTLIKTKNGLKYIQFESFNRHGLAHGFFSRHGGVSPKPFDSLNMATTVGDTNENVLENLRRMFNVFGLDLSTRYDGWQVHSGTVTCVTTPRDVRARAMRTDALITNREDVTLVMRFGDCVPVIVFDPVRRVIAIYHAGWPGTIKRIGRNVVEVMTAVYGSKPADLLAAIGPSIGPDHFVVKEDVAMQFRREFPDDLIRIERVDRAGKITYDLWETNRLILEEVGVKNIETAEICTVCDKQDWFSHRGDKGKTGRFGVLLALCSGNAMTGAAGQECYA